MRNREALFLNLQSPLPIEFLFIFAHDMRHLKSYCVFFLLLANLGLCAQTQKIKILNSEQTYKNELKYPGAIVLNGAVRVSHEGAVLKCKKALYYQKKNLLHAYGNVRINQGDTLHQTSEYTHYNGTTKKVISWGNVVLTDPTMTLKTDTLHFDRTLQELFYNCNATIRDDTNQLKSKKGVYKLKSKKFTAKQNVVVENSENKLVSNYLDYFTDSGQTYFYGPSTLTTPESVAYGEKGFYDTKINISRLVQNAKINYNNRIIEGDSIYSNRKNSFASSSGNIVVTDSLNNSIVKGGYAEFYQENDSVFVVDRPVAISIADKDSLYIHGDTLLITGKPEKRILRAYHHVKIFKTDLRGKCDSLHSNQKTGLTKLFKNPVLWSENNQITGDSIHLLSNPKTNALDSLFIKKNAFIIQKDSAGFSQIKGKNMYGKFENNSLNSLLAKGNGEVINYARDEAQKLIGILKMSCSNILFQLQENAIDKIRFLNSPDGKTYPPSQFPENQKKLEGFVWREVEKPLRMEDIFTHDNPNKILEMDEIPTKD